MKRSYLFSALAVIVIAFTGYYLRYHTSLWPQPKSYTVYFDQAGNLQEASPVLLKGVRVGTVKKVDLYHLQHIRVVFNTDRKISLPEGSLASVGTNDVSGTKALILTPGNGPGTIPENGVIPAQNDTTVMEMFNAKITPVLHNAKVLLKSTDTGLQDFNKLIQSGLGTEVQHEIAGFNRQLKSVNDLVKGLEHRTSDAGKTIRKIDSFTTHPDQKNRNINQALQNGVKQTEDLSRINYTAELHNISENMNKVGNALKQTGQNKLLTDKEAYQTTNRALDSLNQSLKDTRKNPPAFISIP